MAWPAGTPIRSSITANLVATLSGIVAGATYKTTPERVVFGGPNATFPDIYPAIIVAPPSITYRDARNKPAPLNLILAEMTFTVLLVVRGYDVSGGDASETGGGIIPDDLWNLMEDTRLAILTDVTRGGYARDTHVESESPFPFDATPPLWGCEVTVTVTYAHSRTDPTVGA